MYMYFAHCHLYKSVSMYCLYVNSFCTVWSMLSRISLTKAHVLWWCDNKSDLIWFMCMCIWCSVYSNAYVCGCIMFFVFFYKVTLPTTGLAWITVFLAICSHKNSYLCALSVRHRFTYLTARFTAVSKRNVHWVALKHRLNTWTLAHFIT